MDETIKSKERGPQFEEINPKAKSGMAFMLGNIVLMLASVVGFVMSIVWLDAGDHIVLAVLFLMICLIYCCIVGPILFAGLKVLRPNEALVLTLFGKYYGTLRREGFFFVNPFVSALNPAEKPMTKSEASPHHTAAGKTVPRGAEKQKDIA